MKTRLLIALVVLLLPALKAFADVEPNNTIAQAEAAAGGIINGDLGTGGDFDDYYIINLPADALVTVTLTTNGTLQARPAIYNGSGTALVFGSYVTGGTTVLNRDCNAAGPIYVRVDRNVGADTYTMNVAITSVPEANDAEPNNSLVDALPLAFEGSATGHMGYVNGSLSPVDGDDYYYSIPPVDGKINIQAVLSNGLQSRLALYNNSGTALLFGAYSTTLATLTYDCLGADTVFIRLQRNSGCGGYTLSYNWEVVTIPNDVEPNNSFDDALSINGFSGVTGHLGYVNLPHIPTDVDDYYGTMIPTNGNVNIQLITANSLQARILYYNKDRTNLSSSGYVTADTASLTINCVREDSAYIRVQRNSGCGGYQLIYTVDSPDVPRDPEPNDVFDDAIFIGQGLGSERTGHIGFVNGTSDQNDYYFGVPTLDGEVEIRIINDGAQQSRVLLYNDDRATLAASAYSTDTVFLNYDCMAGGDTVYFQVQNNSGCGGYRLFYEVLPNATINDVEPNNSIAEAKPIGEGISLLKNGHLGYLNGSDNPVDNNDYWVAKPADDGKIIITTITENSLQSRILLYSKGGSVLASSSFVTADTNVLAYDCLHADTVYILHSRNSGCGGYQLWYDVENPVQSNDAEPNNLISEAIALASNTAQEGHLGYANNPVPADASDFYAYNPQDTGNLTVRVILTNTLQARVLYYNSSGSFVGSTPFVTADTIEFDYNPPTGDTLYFLVSRNAGCGGYTIEVENGCDQPTGLNEPLIISIGAMIDWDDSPGAVAYNIRGRKATSPNYLVATGIPNSKYTAFPLQGCTQYAYGVESVCATRTSGFTSDKTFTSLCAPYCPPLAGVTVVSVGTTTATIGWSNSIVATGYQLQYSPTLGGPGGTATAPKGTNFVNLTGLIPGTSYDYQVRQNCYDSGVSPFVTGTFTTSTFREGGIAAISIFPNPVDDQLFVQGAIAGSVVTVFNAQGQQVLAAQLDDNSLNVSQLNPGWYTIKVDGEKLHTQTFSIVR